MPLTRLDNLLSSKTGKYLYVSPDDFNASDALDNRGNSPTRPFLTIQRAFLEVARYSYVPGTDNDRFDQFTILLAPGVHYVDNRPGLADETGIPAFNYSAGIWNDSTSLDLSDINNVLYKFNSVEGGAIIPRGTSLVGTDLRRTQVRPLYVPDPADKDIGRTSIFQVTGGCYFWQFTIQDGDLTVNSPLWNSTENIGKVYSQPDSSVLSIPEYSHHKITNFVFARKDDLSALYAKVAKAFSNYQPTIDDPGEFDYRIQENRIVGPLSDSITLESLRVNNITSGALSGTADITVTAKINHGFFVGQYVALTGLNVGQGKLNGVWKVKSISGTNLKEFVYNVPYNAAGLGLINGSTYTEGSTPRLSSTGTTASVQAEVDSVESASPYVFNVSIRSTWGLCGIWADGSRATGFKSMVIAQYTGVSLQKDDRAFIKYDEFTNTWNQANLQDAFSTTPYHIDGTAYWKDDWRNFHVRASEDAFIQCVSVFAVGFGDHFLMESGGDMSITNSNSNFGNTSLHAIGYKPFAFNQDKGGYISHIIPPQKLLDTEVDIKNYYTLNVLLSNDIANNTKLYYGIDEASDPTNRPAGAIDGFKIGARSGEKLYVKLDAISGESGKQIKSAIVSPNGVKKWDAALSTLSPTGQVVGDLDGDGDSDDGDDVREYNIRQDAANLIDSNREFIQSEAFGYILEKYPALQNIPYVNPGITGDTGRYRDAANLIRSNREEIIDSAYNEIAVVYPTFVNPDPVKCRRDIGYIVDALISDLYNGANAASIDAARAYFNATTTVVTTPTTRASTLTTWTSSTLDASLSSLPSPAAVPSAILPTSLGGNNENPQISWNFTLDADAIAAGVSIDKYYVILEDLNSEDTNGFPVVHWQVDDIPNTITSIPQNAVQANLLGATFRSNYLGAPNTTGVTEVGYSGPLPPAGNEHNYRLTVYATLINSSSRLVASKQFKYVLGGTAPSNNPPEVAVALSPRNSDNLDVNFNVVTTINAGTPLANGVVGEEAQSVTAFNKVATEAKRAITNQLTIQDLTITPDPVTGSNTDPASCANVQATIDTLIAITTTAITNGNLNSLPPRNGGSWLTTSKCRRDIGYILEAVATDLRVGGNENTINAAEAYFVGMNLDYINNELTETLDAYNYVRDLAIAAMRNWSFEIRNASTTNGSSVVGVSTTVGIPLGARVSGSGIPANAYVKRIINGTTFELGTADSRLTTGSTVNATATSTTVTLTITLDSGIWAETDNLQPITDSSVIVDTNYPECGGVATAIGTYFTAISTILNSGVGSVSRSPATVLTSSISTRATLFTLSEIGTSSTNPHNLETGTPVRLVPRGINDTVDKRVIRLPRGFDSNTKYYVIAPGRSTEPFDYSNYTSPSGTRPFDGSAATQQAFMLATSEENANAGIYIYSSETDAIDPNVVIEVHQYVQDVNYDLMQYRCSLVSGSNSIFETEGPHRFDKQASNTTPQKVFFRGGSQTPDISGSVLPTLTSGGILPDDIEYFVRYVPPATATENRNTRFTIHTSHADAISGSNEVTFSTFGTKFYVFANHRRTPLKFDPAASLTDANGNNGSWFINTSSTNNGILERLHLPVYDDSRGKTRTTDTWFERVSDSRKEADTIYRLRYVIPKNGNYREPINGFVLKIRTDDTRRLLPQKIVLRPVGAAATFANVVKNGERLGLTNTEQINGSAYNTANPNFISQYDPYVDPYIGETDSDINFSIQSAKKVTLSGDDFLELTCFDVSVSDPILKTKILTSVKVDTPQGGSGNFVVGSTISWSGNSSGTATVHAWFPSKNYLILKDSTGELNYSTTTLTTFTQGSVTANLLEEKDGGRSNKKNFLYTVEGANVYTLTPGDTITLPLTTGGTAQYLIDSVEDVDDFENTYYIFKSETIRKRIKGQQDGIYYLTAIRGDIKPYPTGSGVGVNFRNFKFSQPVSRVYPLSTKNDPLWFQVTDSVVNQEDPNRDTNIVDPPSAISTADNYIHGLVTINDAKRSITKEATLDLTRDPGIGIRSYSGNNAIRAQEGSASAGSEARKISIVGDSDFPTERRVYVELRRPSIARSGNHTFEYLGFGPGNYSTGFPARQQVVLTPEQDFYAQAKKQDAGIVLYTGLNSSGDLYIGNRKINAITGEQTLLDAPITEEEDEEVGLTGALVTTFDDPVTFNNTVTFNYNQVIPPTLSVVTVGVPVLINSEAINTSGAVIKPPLSIQNYTANSTTEEYDPRRNGNADAMTFGNNIMTVGVWRIIPRGSQQYSIRTAVSNITPNVRPISSSPYNNYYDDSQQLNTTNANWGNVPPKPGTILFKGEKVAYTGSLGWIFANDYVALSTTGVNPQVESFQTYDGYTLVKVTFNDTLANLGIRSDTQFRTSNASNPILNSGNEQPFAIPPTVLIDAVTSGTGSVISESGYPGSSSNYVWINISPNPASASQTQLADALGINVSISNSFWKEVGVIGSESIRTRTTSLGDYRVGVNTLARATDSAYRNAFIESETDPRANLDVVGNVFISGKSVSSSIASSSTTTAFTNGVNTKVETNLDNALIIGGNSASPNDEAVLRVSTTNNGRVGINVTNDQLNGTANGGVFNQALAVDGNGYLSGNLRVEQDLAVNGGDLTTTQTTFNLLEATVTTLNFANDATTANLFNDTTGNQTLSVGNAVTGNQTLSIGTSASGQTRLNIHTNSTDSEIDLGSVSNTLGTARSIINIGGARANRSESILTINNSQNIIEGDLAINGGRTNAAGETFALITSTADRLQILSDGSGANTSVDLATNATVLNIASVAGTTTINNRLRVGSSITSESSITLNGGYLSARATVTRSVLGSTPALHTAGNELTLNVDLYSFIESRNIDDDLSITGLTGTDTFTVAAGTQYLLENNQIVFTDQTGLTIGGVAPAAGTVYVAINVTSTSFQIATVASPTVPITTLALAPASSVEVSLNNSAIDTGGVAIWNSTNTVLPLSNPNGFDINQYYLIDDEIIKTTSAPTSVAPFTINVDRAQDGTVAADHADGTIIDRLRRTPRATFLLTDVTGLGSPVDIDLGEFGGSIRPNDFLRIDGTVQSVTGAVAEFVRVTAVPAGDIQTFSINDGDTIPVTTFEVESVTGNTTIGFPSSGAGVDSSGTLTVFDTLTISGVSAASVTAGTDEVSLIITNGQGAGSIETFRVDSSTGNVTANGALQVGGNISAGGALTIDGDFTITDSGTTFFEVDSATGDTIIGDGNSGSLKVESNAPSTSTTTGALVVDGGVGIGENLNVAGDVSIAGGDLVVTSGGTETFVVNNSGAIDLGGIDSYFTSSGGRSWIYRGSTSSTAANLATYLRSNQNYFTNVGGTDMMLILPEDPQTGDMIRFIDTGVSITFNKSLIIRCPEPGSTATAPAAGTAATRIQGDDTGSFAMNGSAVVAGSAWQSGELIIQTKNAGFALVFAGVNDTSGAAIDNASQGWWLVEI